MHVGSYWSDCPLWWCGFMFNNIWIIKISLNGFSSWWCLVWFLWKKINIQTQKRSICKNTPTHINVGYWPQMDLWILKAYTEGWTIKVSTFSLYMSSRISFSFPSLEQSQFLLHMNPFLKKGFPVFSLYMSACLHVCTPHTCNAHRGKKGTSDPLELES